MSPRIDQGSAGQNTHPMYMSRIAYHTMKYICGKTDQNNSQLSLCYYMCMIRKLLVKHLATAILKFAIARRPYIIGSFFLNQRSEPSQFVITLYSLNRPQAKHDHPRHMHLSRCTNGVQLICLQCDWSRQLLFQRKTDKAHLATAKHSKRSPTVSCLYKTYLDTLRVCDSWHTTSDVLRLQPISFAASECTSSHQQNRSNFW